MGEPYAFETRDDAQELYVEQGLTYEQVGERLGIALNTARNWGAQYEWAEKRREYTDSRRALKENLRKLRQNMITKASQNLEPSDIYAVVKLEKLAKEEAKKPDEQKGQEIDRPRVFLENLQWIAGWLKDQDPEGLKILAANFDAMTEAFKQSLGVHRV